MLHSSYQLLNITENASVEEIKKAYRAKAFMLHPDKNPSPFAKEEFIALTEAYEELLAVKSGHYNAYASLFDQTQQRQEKEREAAKQRARAYAQMRYEEFEKTEAAQTLNAVNIIFDHLIFLFVCSLLLAIPAVLTHFYEFTGIILSGFFLLGVARPLLGYVKHLFNLKQLWLALMSLVETYFFRYVILSATNLFVVLKVGLQTLLPAYITLLVVMVPALVCYYLVFKKKQQTQRSFISFCLIPLMVNCLFLLNYWGSSNATFEYYEIWDETTQEKTASHQSTLIQLENNAYSDYTGVRLFADISQMQNRSRIVYQFENGLLGLKVLKKYEFMP